MLNKNQEYMLLYDIVKEGFDVAYKDVSLNHVEYVVGKPYQVYLPEGVKNPKEVNEFFPDIKSAVNCFMRLKFHMYFKGKKV
jgi:hypothetical protein